MTETATATSPTLTHRTANGQARRHALEAVAKLANQPAALVSYRSQGRLLILGPGPAAAESVRRLQRRLPRIIVVSTSKAPCDGGDEGGEWIQAQVTALEGYLGRFRVSLDAGSGSVDLARLVPGVEEGVDLVLDLRTPPGLDFELPPPGYFAPGEDATALQQALEEIPGLVGEFQKPQFFRYDAAICAHGRSGVQACTRCLEACPTGAIHSLGDWVEVNPNLCQGAGSCATSCPTGAITYAYPQPRDALNRLRLLLQAYREAGGQGAVLLLHDTEAGAEALARGLDDLPEQVLPFPCEAVGSLGMDLWLAALAYGAAAVRILTPPGLPSSVHRALADQVRIAGEILAGLGFDPEAVATLRQLNAGIQPQMPRGPDWTPAAFAGLNEKRTVIRLAVDHLQQVAPLPRPFVNLSTGAAFGEVTVDTRRCTLCMACVSQCPAGALVGAEDRPQLAFIEDNCVQCGLCARSCPENAIAPSPRYLYSREARQKLRVLHEEEPFCCVRCGKPFATQSTIRRITGRLRDHPMFQGDALERLKMCEDCRVVAMVLEEGEQVLRVRPGRST